MQNHSKSSNSVSHNKFKEIFTKLKVNYDHNKLLGKGYEIIWKGQPQNINNLSQSLEKVGYIELNVGIKLFELCQKNFQYDYLTIEDCNNLARNLTKCLKTIYGSKNSSVIIKKESQIVESFKIIFYRKKSLHLHEVIMFLIDCDIMNQIVESMIDIFPKQIKNF